LYTADLITERIPATRTLAESIQDADPPLGTWANVGHTIAKFHAAGVHHADLNAHNILLGTQGCSLLDFDRGRIRPRGAWERRVLKRLQRSLQKIQRLHPAARFDASRWEALLDGYRRGSS
jgi:tRNA A-37 threonylcarbamoyl transferase component Bud32